MSQLLLNHCNRKKIKVPYSGKIFDENFRDFKVKVCEIIFAIFIFAISNEPTFELGDRIKQ